MGPVDHRRSTAWAALLAVLAVLPFAALPAAAAGGVVPAVVSAAAPAGAAEAPVLECDASCPMMQPAHRSGNDRDSMPIACHRPASRDADSGDAGSGPSRMSCCDGPANPPAVPLDEAVPSPLQVLDVPPPASQPALPAPPVRAAALESSGPPLPPGPALYTLHSSLLN